MRDTVGETLKRHRYKVGGLAFECAEHAPTLEEHSGLDQRSQTATALSYLVVGVFSASLCGQTLTFVDEGRNPARVNPPDVHTPPICDGPASSDVHDDSLPTVPQAAAETLMDASDQRRPWSVFFYHSEMTDNSVWEVLEDRDVIFRFGSLDSIDFEYELQHDNPVRKFLQPLLSTIQLGVVATKHNDPRGSAFELSPYLLFRWRRLPLKRYLLMSIGIGEGVSYVTTVPTRELEGAGKHLLDFMALEATFALPSRPQWQIVPRIHHRSSAWGFFGDSVSSNALGVGVRYLF
jgi:hypothetical protein